MCISDDGIETEIIGAIVVIGVKNARKVLLICEILIFQPMLRTNKEY